MHLIQSIRTGDYSNNNVRAMNEKEVDPGAVFWFLTNNPEDFRRSFNVGANIEGGRDIYSLYHGEISDREKSNHRNFYFGHPDREEVEAFILNSHKRSHTVFSPDSLRNGMDCILAMSKTTCDKVPINSF